jgi:hypothetical protein
MGEDATNPLGYSNGLATISPIPHVKEPQPGVEAHKMHGDSEAGSATSMRDGLNLDNDFNQVGRTPYKINQDEWLRVIQGVTEGVKERMNHMDQRQKEVMEEMKQLMQSSMAGTQARKPDGSARLNPGTIEGSEQEDGKIVKHNAVAEEPALPTPVRPKESEKTSRHQLRLEEYDFDKFKPQAKNEIVECIKAKVITMSNVPPQSVWLTLQRGSRTVSGEIDEANTAQCPTEEQVRAVVRYIHGVRPRTQRETTTHGAGISIGDQGQQGSMGDRVQEVLGPFGITDPWQRTQDQAE